MNGAAEADGVEGMGWVTATYRFDGPDCGKMCVSVVRTILVGVQNRTESVLERVWQC